MYIMYIYTLHIVCVCVCIVCPEGIQPCNMKNRDLLRNIQDTRNTVHRIMMLQSPSK